jgi:pyruvate carboxylase
MALFMVQNDLTEEDIYSKGNSLDFPNSVVEFFSGRIGQPYHGFPQELQRIILKGKTPLTQRPGELLPEADFDQIRNMVSEILSRPVTENDVLAYSLYPKVFLDWVNLVATYGDVSILDTPTFFYGLNPREELQVDIEEGKTLVIKLISVEEPLPNGTRIVNFELNGLPREVVVKDKSIKAITAARAKAEKDNPGHLGASLTGKVVKIMVDKGDHVKKGESLIVTEAMKMETIVQAPFDAVVKDVFVKPQDAVESGDLLIELSKETASKKKVDVDPEIEA